VIVQALQLSRPGIEKNGFTKAVRQQWPDEGDLHQAAGAIMPDAYEFHHDLRVLTLIEVVDTNPIRRQKADKIGALALALDEVEWEATVAVFDNCGNLMCEIPAYSFIGYNVDHFAPAKAVDVLPAARAFHAGLVRLSLTS